MTFDTGKTITIENFAETLSTTAINDSLSFRDSGDVNFDQLVFNLVSPSGKTLAEYAGRGCY